MENLLKTIKWKLVLHYVFLIATSAYVLVACNKRGLDAPTTGGINIDPPPPPPPDTTRTINLSVVEFNTGAPVANAVVTLRPNYPGLSSISLITDQVGNSNFISTTKKFSKISVSKAGYWNLNDQFGNYGPILFYPDSSIYSQEASYYSCDGFVVKLFPKYTVTIHLKDSSHLPGIDRCGAWLVNQGLFRVNGIDYWTGYNSGIQLHSSTDTTLQYDVFGNTVNEISIWTSFDDDCFLYSPFHIEKHFIQGNNVFLSITY